MSGILIVIFAGFFLLGAYFLYGGYLERIWGVDPKRRTPAHEMRDGVDYVPGRKSVIFGHQFASIAGAGPINGPIIAAMFGWVPVLLWVLIGGVFVGAVQDYASLYASVRNKGRTIGYIIEQHIGMVGKVLFLVFVWLFCILVIAAFADIVAVTFNGYLANGELNKAYASTAATSMLFIVAALIFSIVVNKINPSGAATGVIAIVLLIACIGLGLNFPIYFSKGTWTCIVFAYIFAASVMPVWVLLQPRDYLNSYLLLGMMLAAVIGIFFARPTVNLPAFAGFAVNGFSLFPMLFVIIACGAVSGFHSLVSSGTASKQVSNEKDMRFISYGAMLFESFLAVLALIAVGSLYTNNAMPVGVPPVVFANALSGFLLKVGVSQDISFTLITLAISAFALTSLDSVARVGRLAFQELFSSDDSQTFMSGILGNKYIATTLTLVMGYLLSQGGYLNIWPLFGSSNQLLAALALIAVAVFLKRTGKQGAMLYIPMGFMLLVTMSALGITIMKLFRKIGAASFSMFSDGMQLIFALLLTALAVIVAWQGIARLNRFKNQNFKDDHGVSP